MYEYLNKEVRSLREAIDYFHHYVWLTCEYGAQKETAADLAAMVRARMAK